MTRLCLLAALVGAVTGASALAAPPAGSTTIYFWSDRGRPGLYAMTHDGARARVTLVYRTPQNAKRPTPHRTGAGSLSTARSPESGR